jgi:hypothetical protein
MISQKKIHDKAKKDGKKMGLLYFMRRRRGSKNKYVDLNHNSDFLSARYKEISPEFNYSDSETDEDDNRCLPSRNPCSYPRRNVDDLNKFKLICEEGKNTVKYCSLSLSKQVQAAAQPPITILDDDDLIIFLCL